MSQDVVPFTTAISAEEWQTVQRELLQGTEGVATGLRRDLLQTYTTTPAGLPFLVRQISYGLIRTYRREFRSAARVARMDPELRKLLKQLTPTWLIDPVAAARPWVERFQFVLSEEAALKIETSCPAQAPLTEALLALYPAAIDGTLDQASATLLEKSIVVPGDDALYNRIQSVFTDDWVHNTRALAIK